MFVFPGGEDIGVCSSLLEARIWVFVLSVWGGVLGCLYFLFWEKLYVRLFYV